MKAYFSLLLSFHWEIPKDESHAAAVADAHVILWHSEAAARLPTQERHLPLLPSAGGLAACPAELEPLEVVDALMAAAAQRYTTAAPLGHHSYATHLLLSNQKETRDQKEQLKEKEAPRKKLISPYKKLIWPQNKLIWPHKKESAVKEEADVNKARLAQRRSQLDTWQDTRELHNLQSTAELHNLQSTKIDLLQRLKTATELRGAQDHAHHAQDHVRDAQDHVRDAQARARDAQDHLSPNSSLPLHEHTELHVQKAAGGWIDMTHLINMTQLNHSLGNLSHFGSVVKSEISNGT